MRHFGRYRVDIWISDWRQSGLLEIFLLFLLSSCGNGLETTDTGLEYKYIVKGEGKVAASGEYLILDLLVKTSSDSIIYCSAKAGILFPLRYDTYMQKVGQKNPLQEGFYMMHKGDSAVFAVDASAIPPALNVRIEEMTGDRLFCHARLVDVLSYEDYSKWRTDQITRRKNEQDAMLKIAIDRESKKIDSILTSQNTMYAVSPSGIRYIIEHQGTGRNPEEGDSVFFKYEVTYLDGTALPNDMGDSGDKPRSFRIGSDRVFQSWQESIMLLKKGGSGKFYIPSPLAFGDSEAFGIMPNSVLVVSIRLEDVKKN